MGVAFVIEWATSAGKGLKILLSLGNFDIGMNNQNEVNIILMYKFMILKSQKSCDTFIHFF